MSGDARPDIRNAKAWLEDVSTNLKQIQAEHDRIRWFLAYGENGQTLEDMAATIDDIVERATIVPRDADCTGGCGAYCQAEEGLPVGPLCTECQQGLEAPRLGPCDGCGIPGVDHSLRRGGEDFTLCDDCRDALPDT